MNSTLKEILCSEIKNKNLRVFCAKDFIHLGKSRAINLVLDRMEHKQEITRILTGIYYIPKYIEILDDYETPNISEVAKALARKNNWTITPTGNTALNMLGLSTQVPSKYVYLSTGPYKEYEISNHRLNFKSTNNRELSNYSETSNILIQAIKAVGRENFNDSKLNEFAKQLTILYSKKDIEEILEETRFTSMWIYEIIKIINKKIRGENLYV